MAKKKKATKKATKKASKKKATKKATKKVARKATKKASKKKATKKASKKATKKTTGKKKATKKASKKAGSKKTSAKKTSKKAPAKKKGPAKKAPGKKRGGGETPSSSVVGGLNENTKQAPANEPAYQNPYAPIEEPMDEETEIEADEFDFESLEGQSPADDMDDLDDPFDEPGTEPFDDEDMGDDDEGYFQHNTVFSLPFTVDRIRKQKKGS